MFLGPLVADCLREKRKVKFLDRIDKSLLRIHGEDGKSRVVFFRVDGSW